MKIKLDTNYKVFNNIVKCFMKCTLVNCAGVGYKSTFRGYTVSLEGLSNGDVIQSFAVTALAKCDPRDTFDLETGKRIAESRATIKVLKLINGLIQEQKDYFHYHLTNLTVDNIKVNNILLKEEFHLSTLLDNE